MGADRCRALHQELKGEPHVAAHSDDRANSGALWQFADVAAQQGMGILPKWWDWSRASDPAGTFSDGPLVAAALV